MHTLRTAALAAALAAFSLPAWGQMCAPTEQVMSNLEASGWQMVDALPVPNGSAIAVMCNGNVGGLVEMSPDGMSCLIGQPIAGLCRLPGTES